MFSLDKATNTNGIFVNKDTACENNCPGCSFGVKEADINQKKSINELKLIIDNISEKVNFGENIIFQPGNILLNYSIEEIEELFEYSYNRTGKQSQWEIAKLDERILDFLESEKIVNLLKEQKLFLNIGYLERNLDLLKKIYLKIHKIGKDKRNDEITSKGYAKNFENLNEEEYLSKLNSYIEEGKLEGADIKKSMRFAFHNLEGVLNKGTEKRKDIVEFLEFCGFDDIEESFDYYGIYNNGYYSSESGLWIRPIFVDNNKIKDGVVVWNDMNEFGKERCIMLDEQIELDVIGDNTLRSHTNPCNGISFGNIIKDTPEDIKNNFNKHLNRITNILINNKYKKDFLQSDLCNKCLSGENPEITNIKFISFLVREKCFNFKKKVSSVLFKS